MNRHDGKSDVNARLILSVLMGMASVAPVAAAEPPPTAPCAADTAFALLDFWLGEWDVTVAGQTVGHNRIAKIAGGCAVTEDWTAADGSPGHSLFYYIPVEKTWKQVWVTGNAPVRGGVKEKTLVARLPGGGVRFQGEIRMAGGQSYLDRTTLTPLEGGDVRQLIEISTDAGANWRPVFDARYRRRGGE